MKMTKPGIHVLQGLAMQPLTDLSETPQLSEDERWMEVARIAFPKQRNEQEVIAEQQRFVDRFQGSRSERYVYLSKIFGRRSTWQSFKDYLRTGELPEPQAVQDKASLGKSRQV